MSKVTRARPPGKRCARWCKLTPPRRFFRCRWLGRLAVGALLGSFGRPAQAQQAPAPAPTPPTKASCAGAYESAQESRASGRLRLTIARLQYCAQAGCPAFVKSDCSRWLGEVEAELPSLVVSAPGLTARERGLTTVKLDGEVVPGGLSGSPVTVDPGLHELSLERPGRSPVLRTIVAQQGVQDRPVAIDLGQPKLARNTSDSIGPLSFVAFGVGAIGFGTFGVLGTLARADRRALADDCGITTTDPALVEQGTCLQTTFDDRESEYQNKEVMADVGLVVGIAGAATGVALLVLSLSSSDEDEPTGSNVQLRAGADAAGGWFAVTGQF